MAADYVHPEMTEFRHKIELLTSRGVDAMAAKRIVASDRIAKSERKSRGQMVYNDMPADVEPAVDSPTIRQHWRELRSMVNHYDETLTPLLVSCGVVEVRGHVITLGTHIDRVAERLKMDGCRGVIAQALHDLWQHEFQVEVMWAERAYWLDERWLRNS
jgi:hypothetical protein